MNPYIEAARPRTLSAAVAPVWVGTAAAVPTSDVNLLRMVLALTVAAALQVAVNYANDYFDAVSGIDNAETRLGPRRAVAAGLITPAQMRRAMIIALGVAGVAGLGLAAMTSWWLVAVGAVCVLAALGYSGGPSPYASAALGELFVFIFFGLVATIGSGWVQSQQITAPLIASGVPVGLLAVAIMLTNNLRDIPTDAPAGKNTLAVRLGDTNTRRLFVATLVGSLLCVVAIAGLTQSGWPLLGLVAAPLMRVPIGLVRKGAAGTDLIPALAATAGCQVMLALGLATGLWLTHM